MCCILLLHEVCAFTLSFVIYRQVCTYTHIESHKRMHMHTHAHTHSHTHTHLNAHTYTHTHTHTHTHAYTRTPKRTHAHKHTTIQLKVTHTHLYTAESDTHTYSCKWRTHKHTHTHAYTHMHTNTHSWKWQRGHRPSGGHTLLEAQASGLDGTRAKVHCLGKHACEWRESRWACFQVLPWFASSLFAEARDPCWPLEQSSIPVETRDPCWPLEQSSILCSYPWSKMDYRFRGVSWMDYRSDKFPNFMSRRDSFIYINLNPYPKP